MQPGTSCCKRYDERPPSRQGGVDFTHTDTAARDFKGQPEANPKAGRPLSAKVRRSTELKKARDADGGYSSDGIRPIPISFPSGS